MFQVEGEVLKYRKYAGPFSPIRFLNLLPLSHMFGQAMATFIPPMLPGVVVFMRGFQPEGNPASDSHPPDLSTGFGFPQSSRFCGSICFNVPGSANHAAAADALDPPLVAIPAKYTRLFGWKFWSFIVGAAPLPSDPKSFFSPSGFSRNPKLRSDRNCAHRYVEHPFPRA